MSFSHIDILRSAQLFLSDKENVLLIFDNSSESALALEILLRSRAQLKIILSPHLSVDDRDVAKSFLSSLDLPVDLIHNEVLIPENCTLLAATKTAAKAHKNLFSISSDRRTPKITSFLDTVLGARERLRWAFTRNAWGAFEYPIQFAKFRDQQADLAYEVPATRRVFLAKLSGGLALASGAFLVGPGIWRSPRKEYITVAKAVIPKGPCPGGGTYMCHPTNPTNCWCEP